MLSRLSGLMIFLLVFFINMSVWSNGSDEGDGEIVLDVLWFNDGNESEIFMDTIQGYLESRPNTRVEMQLVPFQDYENRLKLMIAGGDPPDLARITTNHAAKFADVLLPLDEKVNNIDEITQAFSPASMAFVRNSAGQVVALPTEATANGMIVNLDYFQNAGIDIQAVSKTWTWDDWYRIMKEVVAANDGLQYALAYDFSPHRWSTLLYEAGGRFLNEAGTGMNFDSKEAVDALNFFKKIHDENLLPASVWQGSENPQELFKAGLAASHIGGSWMINKYANEIDSFNWAAVNMPRQKIRSSVVGGKFIASFKGAGNADTAVELMLYFSDAERNAMYCRDTYNISSRTDVNIQYADRTDDFMVMSEDLAVTPAITAEDWKNPALNKIYSYIREQIVEGLLGKISMEQVARNIHDKGNSFFE